MEIKYFDRWGVEGVQVTDLGLVPYITFAPVIVPKTGARYAQNRFHKSKITIVERFMNKIMVSGHKGKKHTITSGPRTGKSQTVLKIMEQTFELIEKRTKTNPIVVFVAAIENASPREEIVTIEYGGARYPKSVECAPQRRIDVAIRAMTQGAAQKCFGNNKSIVETLTDEIIHAYNLSNQSAAIQKKFDLERQADASR